MPRSRAFTLIELLTVIAIIAILAAIILPVFARAKENAYRNSDISSMNAIRAALQLYRVDQGAYPPALLGYVTLYASGPNMGNVMPANEINGFLYKKRIPNLDTLRPAFNRSAPILTTTAVWPSQDPRALGSAAAFDSNGDGEVTPIDDVANSRQAFGPTQTVQRLTDDDGNPGTPPVCLDSQFYSISGYDVAEVRTLPGRTELRFAPFWTIWGFGGCGDGLGNAADDPRQLGYDDPPDNTVITWNSYFRNWSSGAPNRDKRELILFLGGSARPADSRDTHERSWRMSP